MPAPQSPAKNRCEAQAADEDRSVVGRHGMASQTVEHHLSIDGAKIEHKSERGEEEDGCEARKPSTLLFIGATAAISRPRRDFNFDLSSSRLPDILAAFPLAPRVTLGAIQICPPHESWRRCSGRVLNFGLTIGTGDL